MCASFHVDVDIDIDVGTYIDIATVFLHGGIQLDIDIFIGARNSI